MRRFLLAVAIGLYTYSFVRLWDRVHGLGRDTDLLARHQALLSRRLDHAAD